MSLEVAFNRMIHVVEIHADALTSSEFKCRHHVTVARNNNDHVDQLAKRKP